MVKFLLLLISIVNTFLLKDKTVEIKPLSWKDFEHRAYTQNFQIPFKRNAPFNKPPTKPYYEMSEYSREWLRKRDVVRSVYRLTVPQYYITPFVTKDMKE